MKRLTKIIAITAAITLTVGCLSVFSAEKFHRGRGMKFPTKSEEQLKNAEERRRPEKIELTEEQKAAKKEEMKTDLAKKLEEGKITQEQYDKMLAKIESGEFAFGRGFGKRPEKGEMPQRPELTEEEKAAKIEEMKTDLAKRLEEGKITQEQYDKMLAKIESGEFHTGRGFGKGPHKNPRSMKNNFSKKNVDKA